MNADSRGFDYPLEPLRQRAGWELDSQLARLGRLQRKIDAAVELVGRLRADHLQDSLEVSTSMKRAFDPRAHAHGLRWLVQLRTRLAEASTEVDTLHAERRALVAACHAQQCKLDAIEAHRDASCLDYARDATARLLANADRDWLARATPDRTEGRTP
jgi:hypothetical protein